MRALTFAFRRPLRPAVIVAVGPTTAGLFAVIAVLFAGPEAWSPQVILPAFGVGIIVGLGIFGPIAAALAFRPRLRRWLNQHGTSVQWYTSLVMVFALGYLVASVVNRSLDAYIGLAWLAVFVCALVKIVVAVVWNDRDDPPPTKGGDPHSSGAPVPRPPNNRPPTLSEAALVKHDDGA